MLTEVIGKPAMLEQTAEECAELAQACLKMARYLRDENKVYKSEKELIDNLVEEMADVNVCVHELFISDLVSSNDVRDMYDKKIDRMKERLSELNK